MYGNNGFMEGDGIIMDSRINFTHEELQLIYAACMSFSNVIEDLEKIKAERLN